MASTNDDTSGSGSGSGRPPSPTLATILEIDQIRQALPAELREKYRDRYAKLLQDMTKDAAEFLHEDLDINKHTEDQVKTVIKAFPSALSHLDDDGSLPIQAAACFERSVSFVPFLAAEGVKFNVGGEGKRGGLLGEDPVYSLNVLQKVVGSAGFLGLLDMDSSACDLFYLDILTKLCESKLLRKDDVVKHHLLFWSCSALSKERFKYLVDWDPEALEKTLYEGVPLLQAFANIGELGNFAMVLKAGIKHYPEHLGFLFRKNNDGITSCQIAFEEYGKDETFKVIQECIPADSKYPILHRVIKNASQYMDDFAKRYPSAIYLRDEHQRLLHHTALGSGTNLSTDAVFILRMRDEEIEERDPVTDLYPFAIAASAEKCDLSTVHYLLRRNPALLERSARVSKHSSSSKLVKAGRKCKRT